MVEITANVKDINNENTLVIIKNCGGKKTITVEGVGEYYVNDLVKSWEYPWNLNNLTQGKHGIDFHTILAIVSELLLNSSDGKLPWYRKIELLLAVVRMENK